MFAGPTKITYEKRRGSDEDEEEETSVIDETSGLLEKDPAYKKEPKFQSQNTNQNEKYLQVLKLRNLALMTSYLSVGFALYFLGMSFRFDM